jgi:hypothetical protein
MFETNNIQSLGADPTPVSDLKLSINSDGKVLLKWTKPNVPSSSGWNTARIQPALATTGRCDSQRVSADETPDRTRRAYRIISLR